MHGLPCRLLDCRHRIALAGWLMLACVSASPAQSPNADTAQPAQPLTVLNLPAAGADPMAIDYAALPVLDAAHAVVSPPDETLKFQLHNYLVHHDGQYWCMWSQGPPVEDEPGQFIRYATSSDGLSWRPAKVLVGPPQEGYAYIARGFWVRDGQLLALVAHFKGKGAFGVNKELQLQALAFDKASESWRPQGVVFDNAINNFPPQKLPTGQWMMTRRDARFNVFVLIGGQKALDQWQAYPVVQRLQVKGFSPDEPIWWAQPDKTLVALFRDNGGSSRLYHATSADNGRTWTTPVLTNFPNSSSKIFSLDTSRGYRVMISNANPGLGRRQLHLSITKDGLTFGRMALLNIPSPRPTTLQYPHAIEHDGHLLIAFSRKKANIEILKIPLDQIDALSKESP